MISDARRGHVSPGIYTEEKDVQFSVKSLGITSLGLVGETLYGPAFQNVEISKWGDFVDYFGGTSSEKFKNGNLKYELPYVAKSYLEESNRLNVVRVLGLSGYDAGKAWVLSSASGAPIMVLRSNMTYSGGDDKCNPNNVETAIEIVESMALSAYTNVSFSSSCDGSGSVSTVTTEGKIGIVVKCKDGFPGSGTYYVSFNPGDNDYIYNVISSKPNGNTPFYIEAVYESNILNGKLSTISSASSFISYSSASTTEEKWYKVIKCDFVGSGASATTKYKLELEPSTKQNSGFKLSMDEVFQSEGSGATSGISGNTCYYSGAVNANAFIYFTESGKTDNFYTSFKEGYRAAQTPWIVSEASFSANTAASVKRLFRFVTISESIL